MPSTRERYDDEILAWQYEYSEGHRVDAADVRHYATRLRESAGPLLELGCGTGRLTLPVASTNCRAARFVALDEAQSMLHIARQKAREAKVEIEFRQGDACSIDLDLGFSEVFCGYNTISMVGDERIDAMVAAIRRHLVPDGAFLFDLRRGTVAQYRDCNLREIPWTPWLDLKEVGVRLRRRMELRFDDEHQSVQTTYFWHIEGSDGSLEERETTMWFSVREPEWYVARFEAAGFRLVGKRDLKDGRRGLHCYCEVARC